MSSLLSRMIILTMLFVLLGKIGFSVIEEFNDSSDQIESVSDSEESDDSTESEDFMKNSLNNSTPYKDLSILKSELKNRIYQAVIFRVKDTIIGISSPPPKS